MSRANTTTMTIRLSGTLSDFVAAIQSDGLQRLENLVIGSRVRYNDMYI